MEPVWTNVTCRRPELGRVLPHRRARRSRRPLQYTDETCSRAVGAAERPGRGTGCR
jgi:hypothetical protein